MQAVTEPPPLQVGGVEPGQVVGQVTEPVPGAFRVEGAASPAARAVFGQRAVDGGGEVVEEVVLQLLGAAESPGVQERGRVVVGGVAVDGAGERDHQRSGQHRGEVGTCPGERLLAQLAQYGIPGGRRKGSAAGLACGARQIVGQIAHGEIGQIHRGGRGEHVGLRHRGGVLGRTARQQQRERGGVERFQRGTPQAVGDLVEAVQHGEHPAGLDQCGGKARPAGSGGGETGVIARQLCGEPVPEGEGGRIPGADGEDHRYGFGAAPGPQVVQDEPHGENRLPGARAAQDHQPPGGDPPVHPDDVVQLPAQVQRAVRPPGGQPADVRPVIGQLIGDRPPAHRQWIGIVDLPLFLLALPAGGHRLGELLGHVRQGFVQRRLRPGVRDRLHAVVRDVR